MYFLNKILYWHNSCSILKSIHKNSVQTERHKTNNSSLKSWEEQQQNYLKSAVQLIQCSSFWSVHFLSGPTPQKENIWSKSGTLEATQMVLEHPIPPGKRLPNNAKTESTKVVLMQPEWKAVLHNCPTEKRWAARNCQALLVGDTSIEHYVLTLQSVGGTHEPK